MEQSQDMEFFFRKLRKFNPYNLSRLWWYYKIYKMIALLLRYYITYYFEKKIATEILLIILYPVDFLLCPSDFGQILLNCICFLVHKDCRLVFFNKITLLTLWRRCFVKILELTGQQAKAFRFSFSELRQQNVLKRSAHLQYQKY